MRPTTLSRLVPSFAEAMRVRRYAETTIGCYQSHLVRFVAFCRRRQVTRAADVDSMLLEDYRAWFFATGAGPMTREKCVVAIHSFFAWLTKHGHIPRDPSRLLEVPRRPRRLPRNVLTASKMEKLLSLPDVATPEGIRDRAILEVLYSTGIRRQELLDLTLADVHAARGVVHVRDGKGRKDRVVPIGERALHWLDRYLEAQPSESDRLFPMSRHALGETVRGYLDAIGVPRGGCHLLRHTMATVMLERGADVVSIGEMLGHARIDTTELYTNVSLAKLREVHAATHPACRPSPEVGS